MTALDPSVTVTELNDIYSSFDRIGEQFELENMGVQSISGLPDQPVWRLLDNRKGIAGSG